MLIFEKILNKGIYLFLDLENGFYVFKRERNLLSIVFGRWVYLFYFLVKWVYFYVFIRFIIFLYKNINKNLNVNIWKFSISEIIEGLKMYFKLFIILLFIFMILWWLWLGWLNLLKERKLKSEFLILKFFFCVWL